MPRERLKPWEDPRNPLGCRHLDSVGTLRGGPLRVKRILARRGVGAALASAR